MKHELKPIKRALISVFDKTSIVPLAKKLSSLGVEIVSTGNTASTLRKEDIPVVDVANVTNFPEMLGGRVKTLHPAIHAGILAKPDEPSHVKEISEHNLNFFDLVISNLYPFQKTIADKNSSEENIIEMIDIGGPTIIRAAAKNYKNVTIITSVEQYDTLKQELALHSGATCLKFRKKMAKQAFLMIEKYDHEISSWFMKDENKSDFSESFTLNASKIRDLSYGENPHQKASLYRVDNAIGAINSQVIKADKSLSYNNYVDADTAISIVSSFSRPACAIIKHKVSCGFAINDTTENTIVNAIASDPTSAFGGVVATNSCFSKKMAENLKNLFVEMIIAPDFEEEALAILLTRKNLRILKTKSMPDISDSKKLFRQLRGGIILQDPNLTFPSQKDMKVMTRKTPSDKQWQDIHIATRLVSFANSNAVAIVNENRLIGLGSGQTSRVQACKLAVSQAKLFNPSLLENSVAASDGFFPFFDGIKILNNANIKTIAHPGGSKNDEDIINQANNHNISIIQHGIRSFAH